MKPHRRKRLSIIIFIALSLSVAIGLGAYALRQNINLFYTPTQVSQGEVAVGQYIRIGGMVKVGSLESASDSLKVRFAATDYATGYRDYAVTSDADYTKRARSGISRDQ